MALAEALKSLQSRIGQEIHRSYWLTIDQAMIDDFANATRDRQWIHVDAQRAAVESPYRKTIAHGYLTLSLTRSCAAWWTPASPSSQASLA